MNDEAVFTRNLELQGVPAAGGRTAAVAAVLARQIAAERAATDQLAFEDEPAGFTRELEHE